MRHFPLCLPGFAQSSRARDQRASWLSALRSKSAWFALLLGLCGCVAYAQTPVSDAFNESSLNTSLWTVKAPVSGSALLTGGELQITVPGGVNHQAFTPLNAVRVVQPVSNANFDVYVKINSQLGSSGQDGFAGLLVGGDGSDYIYYYLYSDGTNVDLLSASIDSGVQNIRFNTIPFAGYPVPTYLRMQRVGTTYTAYWSADAMTWNVAGNFSDNLAVTHLGPFAGNSNSTPANAPAVLAAFGGFENTPAASTTAAPAITPPTGTDFTSTLNVTITDTTPNATIYYTTDGSTPTTSSSVYSESITLTASATVKAIATASGLTPSGISSASYTQVAAGGAPISDEFNESTLNTSLWTVRAPVGGTGAVSNGELVLTVPAGSNHDAFVPALDAVQLVQSVANQDFDVAVKVDSTLLPNAVYSGLGIMVEGDAKDYIRFEVFAEGNIALSASTISSGSQSSQFQISPFSGYVVPTYLRLQRVGTTYTPYWSSDGINWNKVGSFTDNLAVTGLAPYAWNYNSTPANAPALTAKFDWFHNLLTTTAAPAISPASGTSFSSTLTVTITDATPNATIYYTTNGSTPTTSSAIYGGAITLNASATVNAIAVASGFTQSEVSSASYTYASTQSAAATPTFSPASGTTFSSTQNVTITDSTPNATIHYTTDNSTPTTSSAVYSGAITLTASATVKAIATASGYTQSAIGSASYTYTGGGTGGVVSDNFDESTLNTALWTTENPLGDGIVTMIGTAATLNVPKGTTHDLWTTADNSLRIMQPVGNSNFSVDVRFQSAPEIGNQDEGILAEQDTGDFVRFDVLFNGTAGPELFAAGISGGNASTFLSTQITLPKAPVVLRLARNGNVWTGSWSTDGVTFTTATSFTFDLNVARVGPYAATYASTASNSPAFTAIVDYFFATADPITNQDGPQPYGYATVDANPPGTLVEKTLIDVQGTGQLEPVIGLEQYSVNGNNSNGGIYWYSYPTSGGVQGTWVRHTIVADGNAYEDMATFDVNGDGAPDLIASYNNSSGNYQIVWFENPRGSGGDPTQPWTQHQIGPGYGENNLDIADIDGDGKLDVITPSSVFFQNSADSWTQVQYSSSFRGVAVLDIGSGLGKIDLAGTGPSPAYNLVWYENPRETGGNARTGQWIMHTIASTPYPCANTNECGDGGDAAAYNAVDVNGDGLMDVISGQSEGPETGPPPPGGLIWWQAPSNRRTGTWIKHTIDPNMIDVHKIAVGDMDKNGTQDIIVAEQDQSPLRRVTVYYNDGNGLLTPEIISNAEGHNICVGDVTGSGSLDILNSGHGYFDDAHPLQIFLNPY